MSHHYNPYATDQQRSAQVRIGHSNAQAQSDPQRTSHPNPGSSFRSAPSVLSPNIPSLLDLSSPAFMAAQRRPAKEEEPTTSADLYSSRARDESLHPPRSYATTQTSQGHRNAVAESSDRSLDWLPTYKSTNEDDASKYYTSAVSSIFPGGAESRTSAASSIFSGGGESRFTTLGERKPHEQSIPGLGDYEFPVRETISAKPELSQPKYTSESACKILLKFGLEKEDLEQLTSYSEDQITPQNLPFILRQIRQQKTKAYSEPKPTTSVSDTASRGHMTEVPHQDNKPRGILKTSKVIDYGHVSQFSAGPVEEVGMASGAHSVGSSTLLMDSSRISSCDQESSVPSLDSPLSFKLNSKSLPTSNPSKQFPTPPKQLPQTSIVPFTISKTDMDFGILPGVSKSLSLKGPEPSQLKSSKPCLSDTPSPSVASGHLGVVLFDSLKDPCQPLKQVPKVPEPKKKQQQQPAAQRSPMSQVDTASGVPAPAQMYDYVATPPGIYPHSCSLCNKECLSVKEWINHQNTELHLGNCKLLRTRFPEWDGELLPSLSASDVEARSSTTRPLQSRKKWRNSSSRSRSRSYSPQRHRDSGIMKNQDRSRYNSNSRLRSNSPCHSSRRTHRSHSRSRSQSPLYRSTTSRYRREAKRSYERRSSPRRRDEERSSAKRSRSRERRSKSSTRQMPSGSAEALTQKLLGSSAIQALSKQMDLEAVVKTLAPAILAELTKMKTLPSSSSSSSRASRKDHKIKGGASSGSLTPAQERKKASPTKNRKSRMSSSLSKAQNVPSKPVTEVTESRKQKRAADSTTPSSLSKAQNVKVKSAKVPDSGKQKRTADSTMQSSATKPSNAKKHTRQPMKPTVLNKRSQPTKGTASGPKAPSADEKGSTSSVKKAEQKDKEAAVTEKPMGLSIKSTLVEVLVKQHPLEEEKLSKEDADRKQKTGVLPLTGEMCGKNLLIKRIACVDMKSVFSPKFIDRNRRVLQITNLPKYEDGNYTERDVANLLTPFGFQHEDEHLHNIYVIPQKRMAFLVMPTAEMAINVIRSSVMKWFKLSGCRLCVEILEHNFSTPMEFYQNLKVWMNEKVNSRVANKTVFIKNISPSEARNLREVLNKIGDVVNYVPLLNKVFIEFNSMLDADRLGVWYSLLPQPPQHFIYRLGSPQDKVTAQLPVKPMRALPDHTLRANVPIISSIPLGCSPPFGVTMTTFPFIFTTVCTWFNIPPYKNPSTVDTPSNYSTIMMTRLPVERYCQRDVARMVWGLFPQRNINSLFYRVVVLPLQRRAFIYFNNPESCWEFTRRHIAKRFRINDKPVDIYSVDHTMNPEFTEETMYRQLMELSNAHVPLLSGLDQRLLVVQVSEVSLELIQAVMKEVANVGRLAGFLPLGNRICIEMLEPSDRMKVMEAELGSLTDPHIWNKVIRVDTVQSLHQHQLQSLNVTIDLEEDLHWTAPDQTAQDSNSSPSSSTKPAAANTAPDSGSAPETSKDVEMVEPPDKAKKLAEPSIKATVVEVLVKPDPQEEEKLSKEAAADGKQKTELTMGEMMGKNLLLKKITCVDMKRVFSPEFIHRNKRVLQITNLPKYEDGNYTERDVANLLTPFGFQHEDEHLHNIYIIPQKRMALAVMPTAEMVIKVIRVSVMECFKLSGCKLFLKILEDNISTPMEFYVSLMMWMNEKITLDQAERIVFIKNISPNEARNLREVLNKIGNVKNYAPLLNKVFIEFDSIPDADCLGVWYSFLRLPPRHVIYRLGVPQHKGTTALPVNRKRAIPDLRVNNTSVPKISSIPLGCCPPFNVTMTLFPFIFPTVCPWFHIPRFQDLSAVKTASPTIMMTGLPVDGYCQWDVARMVWDLFTQRNFNSLFYRVVVLPLQRRAFIYFNNNKLCKEFTQRCIAKPFCIKDKPVNIYSVDHTMNPRFTEETMYRQLMELSNAHVPPLSGLDQRLLVVLVSEVSLELIQAVVKEVASVGRLAGFLPLGNRICIEMLEPSDRMKVMEAELGSLTAPHIWNKVIRVDTVQRLDQHQLHSLNATIDLEEDPQWAVLDQTAQDSNSSPSSSTKPAAANTAPDSDSASETSKDVEMVEQGSSGAVHAVSEKPPNKAEKPSEPLITSTVVEVLVKHHRQEEEKLSETAAVDGKQKTGLTMGEMMEENLLLERIPCVETKSFFSPKIINRNRRVLQITNLPKYEDVSYTERDVANLLTPFGFQHEDEHLHNIYVIPQKRMALAVLPTAEMAIIIIRASVMNCLKLSGCKLIVKILEKNFIAPIEFYQKLMKWMNEKITFCQPYKIIFIKNISPSETRNLREVLNKIGNVKNYVPLLNKVFIEFGTIHDADRLGVWYSLLNEPPQHSVYRLATPRSTATSPLPNMAENTLPDLSLRLEGTDVPMNSGIPLECSPPFYVTMTTFPFIFPTSCPWFNIPPCHKTSTVSSTMMMTGLPVDGYCQQDVARMVWSLLHPHNIISMFYRVMVLPLQRRAFIYFNNPEASREFSRRHSVKPFCIKGKPINIHFVNHNMDPGFTEETMYRQLMKWSNAVTRFSKKLHLQNPLLVVQVSEVSLHLIRAVVKAVASVGRLIGFLPLGNRICIEMLDPRDCVKVKKAELRSLTGPHIWKKVIRVDTLQSLHNIQCQSIQIKDPYWATLGQTAHDSNMSSSSTKPITANTAPDSGTAPETSKDVEMVEQGSSGAVDADSAVANSDDMSRTKKLSDGHAPSKTRPVVLTLSKHCHVVSTPTMVCPEGPKPSEERPEGRNLSKECPKGPTQSEERPKGLKASVEHPGPLLTGLKPSKERLDGQTPSKKFIVPTTSKQHLEGPKPTNDHPEDSTPSKECSEGPKPTKEHPEGSTSSEECSEGPTPFKECLEGPKPTKKHLECQKPIEEHPGDSTPSTELSEGSTPFKEHLEVLKPTRVHPEGSTPSKECSEGLTPFKEYLEGLKLSKVCREGPTPSKEYSKDLDPLEGRCEGLTPSEKHLECPTQFKEHLECMIPSKKCPEGPAPSTQLPQGPTPTQELPQGSTLSEQLLQGPIPTEKCPHGPTPIEKLPQGPTSSMETSEGSTQSEECLEGPTTSKQPNLEKQEEEMENYQILDLFEESIEEEESQLPGPEEEQSLDGLSFQVLDSIDDEGAAEREESVELQTDPSFQVLDSVTVDQSAPDHVTDMAVAENLSDKTKESNIAKRPRQGGKRGRKPKVLAANKDTTDQINFEVIDSVKNPTETEDPKPKIKASKDVTREAELEPIKEEEVYQVIDSVAEQSAPNAKKKQGHRGRPTRRSARGRTSEGESEEKQDETQTKSEATKPDSITNKEGGNKVPCTILDSTGSETIQETQKVGRRRSTRGNKEEKITSQTASSKEELKYQVIDSVEEDETPEEEVIVTRSTRGRRGQPAKRDIPTRGQTAAKKNEEGKETSPKVEETAVTVEEVAFKVLDSVKDEGAPDAPPVSGQKSKRGRPRNVKATSKPVASKKAKIEIKEEPTYPVIDSVEEEAAEDREIFNDPGTAEKSSTPKDDYDKQNITKSVCDLVPGNMIPGTIKGSTEGEEEQKNYTDLTEDKNHESSTMGSANLILDKEADELQINYEEQGSQSSSIEECRSKEMKIPAFEAEELLTLDEVSVDEAPEEREEDGSDRKEEGHKEELRSRSSNREARRRKEMKMTKVDIQELLSLDEVGDGNASEQPEAEGPEPKEELLIHNKGNDRPIRESDQSLDPLKSETLAAVDEEQDDDHRHDDDITEENNFVMFNEAREDVEEVDPGPNATTSGKKEGTEDGDEETKTKDRQSDEPASSLSTQQIGTAETEASGQSDKDATAFLEKGWCEVTVVGKRRKEPMGPEAKRSRSQSPDVPADFTLPTYIPGNPLGQDFVVPQDGFFCNICSIMYVNENAAVEDHCSSRRHYDNLKKYYLKPKTTPFRASSPTSSNVSSDGV